MEDKLMTHCHSNMHVVFWGWLPSEGRRIWKDRN